MAEPNEAGEPTESVENSEETNWTTSRRSVLAGIGGAGVAFGLSGVLNRQQEQSEYRLGGQVSAWQGQSPESISGEDNPTLELQAGTEYTVVWENLDGLPHDFVIRSENGNALVHSEIVSEEGATQTVTFTATPEMATYICTVHPTSMVGDVSVSGSMQTTQEPQTEEPPAGGEFFAQGTEVGTQMVAEGMTAPTDLAYPADESERRFVTDQTGQVWVVTEDGRQSEPFIDIQDRMVELGEFYGLYASPDQQYDERGLLGIAFHPNFSENRKFYLHYSAPPTQELIDINWDHIEVLSEFTASEDLSSADPESERKLLSIPSPQYNHDAGPMSFGPDGYLYYPMGDGGGANDDFYGHAPDWYETNTGGNAQDLETNMMGNILRIDVDSQDGDRPYGVPEDNPFVEEEGVYGETYAYGFRNPFGISFDSEGNLFQADAGQNLWEEANVVEAGGNYGWNIKEGTHCFSTANPSDPSAITECPDTAPDEAPYNGAELIDPIVEYPHTYEGSRVGVVIVGGHRYEQSTISGLQGKYVFGEYNGNPAGQEPGGRVLAATPPEGFGQGGDGDGAQTTESPGNETATGNETMTTTEGMDTQTEGTETQTAGNETGTTAPGTPGKASAEDETLTTVPGEEAGEETVPPEGPEVVPRDELWEMEELVFQSEFNWFVRMFGQGPDGEIYVLVSKSGVPEGDSGSVLKLVPPEQDESDEAAGTTEAPGNETATGNETTVDGGTTTGDGVTGNDTATDGVGNETLSGNDSENDAGGVGTGMETPGFGVLTSAAAALGTGAMLLNRGDDDEE